MQLSDWMKTQALNVRLSLSVAACNQITIKDQHVFNESPDIR